MSDIDLSSPETNEKEPEACHPENKGQHYYLQSLYGKNEDQIQKENCCN